MEHFDTSNLGPQTAQKLAASLTAEDTGLLPFLPYLLQDIYHLGGNADVAVELLRAYGPPTPSKLLDLACGKGAVSLAVARALGHAVRGVDLLPSFVAEANNRAELAGVADRCHYVTGDAAAAVRELTGWDIVVFSAAGDVLGAPANTLRLLAGTLRAGGWLLLDEFCLPDAPQTGALHPAGAGAPSGPPAKAGTGPLWHPGETLTEAQWNGCFAAAGFTAIEKRQGNKEALAEKNRGDLACIERRAAELAERQPEKAALFAGYVRSRRNQMRKLENGLLQVAWLLRCAGA